MTICDEMVLVASALTPFLTWCGSLQQLDCIFYYNINTC